MARVSEQGVVTGLAEGSATVTASSEGFEAEASVLVSIPVGSVVIDPAAAVKFCRYDDHS